jgi:hypothetical protein
MLWRKKTVIRGQGRVLDVDEDGKSEITFACFCSLLTLHAALDELLRDIPTHCPLLLMPIAWTQEDREGRAYHPNSPSIDRIDNTKGVFLLHVCIRFCSVLIFCAGYIKGNVWIVSHRANTIKNSANAQELERIALNLRAREHLQARLP